MSSAIMNRMLGFSPAPAHAAPAMPNTAAMVKANTPLLNSLLFPSRMSEPSWPRCCDVSDRQRPLGTLDCGASLGRPHVGVFPSRSLTLRDLGQHWDLVGLIDGNGPHVLIALLVR